MNLNIKKNKILKITCCLLPLISNMVSAGNMGEYASALRNYFYIAGDIGVASMYNKESHSIDPETHQLGAAGIIGGGYAGYEFNLDRYGLGLEFFADATGLNAAITHDPCTYQRNQSYLLGFRILPKFAFTGITSGHVLLGYTNGQFNISDNGVYGYINTHYNKSGFQTGLGITTDLYTNLSVRLDAIYNLYGSETSIGSGLTAGSVQLYTNTFNTLAGELSVIYKFA